MTLLSEPNSSPKEVKIKDLKDELKKNGWCKILDYTYHGDWVNKNGSAMISIPNEMTEKEAQEIMLLVKKHSDKNNFTNL